MTGPQLTPDEMAADARANYAEACRAIRWKDSGYVSVHERVTETARTIYRPATPEEISQLKIAEGINGAAS